jgi:serine/threonine protein phosphatase 1
VTAVERWLADVEALLPACLERLLALSADAAALETHPLRAMLHMARRGRLDLPALRERCPSPRRTLEVAAAVGVAAPSGVPLR